MQSPLIEVKNLHKHFVSGKSGILRRGQHVVRAVDDVSFAIEQGEILALVGESGCGKSTLALTLIGLEKATDGAIIFDGEDVTRATAAESKQLRRQIQMIFQDPYESLNPVMQIKDIIAETLEVHKIGANHGERTEMVLAALEAAGLKPAQQFMERYQHELSGGQRQRVVIAGALVLEPSVLLADEPVSMLDVSIRAEILNLLADLRNARGISMLYITHDLSTVAYIADRIAVMYLGRIVEIGPAQDVLNHPRHPYTKALRSVVPAPNPRLRGQHIILEGETPDPIDLPNYCRFAARCPFVIDQCLQIDPRLEPVGDQQYAACIRADELLESR
jgi:oligopeptide/dipeptide ABC transporter ATP-binding protein